MAANKYYPEDVLVEKMQSGEYGWLDYINHHSAKVTLYEITLNARDCCSQ